MTPRFPIDEAADPAAGKFIEEALNVMHNGPPPFKWKEDDGRSLIACYAPLCYTPEITKLFFELAKIAYRPDNVKPRNRELAIMGLCSILNVPYVVYSHRGVAEHAGLTKEQYDEGLKGKVPQGLTEEEEMAYRLGRILTVQTRPLDDQTWQEITAKVNKTEFVGILHVIAGYRWIALLEHANGEDQRWK
ncbi:hypothetical protein N656DRAFT_741989 [Canariomyces notabilis]|uniref:Carboxymuconolactone decarboxylase-like domain-containing protein n=1 Tax=Canariomyces notabilis TaxID=2074819 RepID=A0AAN6T841_9PEZI|nr:hypothetical protein N656DRAFT_741989 [Canariomyces arenarius]